MFQGEKKDNYSLELFKMFMTELLHEQWLWSGGKGLYIPKHYAGPPVKTY